MAMRERSRRKSHSSLRYSASLATSHKEVAIAARQIGNIVQMALVQIAVAMFQVLFLYRELVDTFTPWLAQQGVTLGLASTLGLAFCAWLGVRGMTWYLFGRSGAPALIAALNRPAGISSR